MLRISFFLLLFTLLGLAAPAASVPSIPNFHQVNDRLYRGGQPSKEAWKQLASMGVTTVLNLCDGDARPGERAEVEAAGMTYLSVPMSSNGIGEPSPEKVAEALSVLDHPGAVVFVHCHRGSDRTGTVVACYRIEHDHWTAAQAQQEANGYGMSWVNIGMKRFVAHFRVDTIDAGATMPVGN